MKKVRITEIFYSLQGETHWVGWPTVFVRLTGCPLRCQYCDTAYAFSGGTRMALTEILERVAYYRPRYVTVTGGEPLAQPACFDLLTALCNEGYFVSLETSGVFDISSIDTRVVRIVDFKTPDSGEVRKNNFDNVPCLRKQDQVKFVICSRRDYQWSCETVEHYDLTRRCDVLFSPSYQQLDSRVLAEWILADKLPVRFQLQMHKQIWGDVPGR